MICPDVAGRGESEWLPSPLSYHFGQFLADFRSLLVHVGAQQVDWVGTSMGGLLGLMLASQPSSPIRTLVMNDVGAFVPLDALTAIARNLEAPPRFDKLSQVEAYLRHTHRDWGEIDDAQWKRIVRSGARRFEGGWRLHYDPRIARPAQPMPFSSGLYFWGAWYQVRCPVLLIRGEHSEVFPADVAETMLDAKPETELVEIPGAGHAPSLMAPSQIAIVRRFLERTTTPRVGRAKMPAHEARLGKGEAR